MESVKEEGSYNTLNSNNVNSCGEVCTLSKAY